VQRRRKLRRGSRKKLTQRAEPISQDEWLDGVRTELLVALDPQPEAPELNLTLKRIFSEFLLLCGAIELKGPFPSDRKRDDQVAGRQLRAAAKIIERLFEGGAPLSLAATTMAIIRRRCRVTSDLPRLGASPADIDAVNDIISFLRLLADTLIYEPSALEKRYYEAKPLPRKKLYVWRIAEAWSTLRQQALALATVGSPERPSRLLSFLIAATQPLQGAPSPRGLSEATLQRLARELVRLAREYTDGYVHLLAKKTSD
jgi:hypothetical protein